ncbi:hypothetical protein SMCF_1922 [Streptomyces coelicoflavus ZG0656]|nr:hypothetical protein SMCF_1922 [Streptomyces coelicoflavus ZG0656]MZE44946.1 hypothetical protein [Streptomyces sp. SID5477]
MSTTNETARRQQAARRGQRVRLGRPEPVRYYVRYLRDDGVIITRSFVLESAARKFADRLTRYGKRDVEIWEDTSAARRRWAQLQ